MPETTLDQDGRLSLPEEVRSALGWQPGEEILLRVEGDRLLVERRTESVSVRDEARRLATAMRDLTAAAAGKLAGEAEAALAHARGAAPSPEAAGPGIIPFHGILPRIGEGVFLAPGCSVWGDVSVGSDVSIWPGVVLRGDVASIRVGARTNIQDGSVIHVSPHAACVIGAGVTIGHQATVHACHVADNVLIGIQSVVLDGARIGERCIIAAGAVVPPGMEIPPGKMVMGVPAKVVRDLTPEEVVRIHWNADAYVTLKAQYLNPQPVPPDGAERVSERPTPPAPGILPRYECRRAAGEIVIDGSLDDPGWRGVGPLSSLLDAVTGAEPAEATEVRACWDDHCLYLSFACKDADIWGNFQDRDDPIYEEEVVEAFLSPSGDPAHYFEFEVSPNNVLFDARVFNATGDSRGLLVEKEWDSPGTRTAVRISGKINDRSSPDIGWIAELAIPFADLGLSGPPAPGTVWRANFYRIERGPHTEFTAWSPTRRDPADFHVPASFGELLFINPS